MFYTLKYKRFTSVFRVNNYNVVFYHYDVASGSEITPCNKIDKLVVYRFTDNVMTSITTLRT